MLHAVNVISHNCNNFYCNRKEMDMAIARKCMHALLWGIAARILTHTAKFDDSTLHTTVFSLWLGVSSLRHKTSHRMPNTYCHAYRKYNRKPPGRRRYSGQSNGVRIREVPL